MVLTVEGVVKLPRRLRVTMLYISYFGVDSDLYPRVFASLVELLSRSADEGRVRVHHMSRHIQYATDRYWVQEC